MHVGACAFDPLALLECRDLGWVCNLFLVSDRFACNACYVCVSIALHSFACNRYYVYAILALHFRIDDTLGALGGFPNYANDDCHANDHCHGEADGGNHRNIADDRVRDHVIGNRSTFNFAHHLSADAIPTAKRQAPVLVVHEPIARCGAIMPLKEINAI